jgi:hypothetical protein
MQTRAGDARVEYAALHKRAETIGKDLNSDNEARAKHAAGEWEKFLKDFEAWAKKHGVKLEERVIRQEGAQPTALSFGGRHNCAGTIRGEGDNGAPYICHFKRHSFLRGCIYTCGTDPNGTWNPF